MNAWEFFKQGAVEPGGTAADDTVVRGEPRVDFLDLQQGFLGFVPIDIAAGQRAFQSCVASNAFSTKGNEMPVSYANGSEPGLCSCFACLCFTAKGS